MRGFYFLLPAMVSIFNIVARCKPRVVLRRAFGALFSSNTLYSHTKALHHIVTYTGGRITTIVKEVLHGNHAG